MANKKPKHDRARLKAMSASRRDPTLVSASYHSLLNMSVTVVASGSVLLLLIAAKRMT